MLCTIFEFNFFRFAFSQFSVYFFFNFRSWFVVLSDRVAATALFITNGHYLCVCAKDGQCLCTGNSIRSTLECRSGVDLFNMLCLREDRPLLPLPHIQAHTLTWAQHGVAGRCTFAWWIYISNTCFVNHQKILGLQVCVFRYYTFETDRWCVII